MSKKVDQFLSESGGNNFTVTETRPPALGEENEKESNGGMSTQSSGSHKSQVSYISSRSIASNKGDVNPATPRKSNIDKAIQNLYTGKTYVDDIDAPLGFEPEGSAANSPPFTENGTPPYLKWTESLHYLLNDREGVQLFRTFLDQEGIGTCSVDFWFACQGLKLKRKNRAHVLQIIKIIHRTYIKSDKLPYVDLSVKQIISENILQLQTDHDSRSRLQVLVNVGIFNEAQIQVERYMKSDTYPLFLKSDLYVQHMSKEAESPKTSNSNSGSNSARPLSLGPLSTLKEDQELQQGNFAVSFSACGPPLTNSKVNCLAQGDTKKQELVSVPYNYERPVPYHHVSYAPVSAQGSQIQSLSSQDALMDETRSLSDRSLDGHLYIESRRQRRLQHNSIQTQAEHNLETCHNFIPRTLRVPQDAIIAEADPLKFANMLIQRLLKVQRELEKEEHTRLNLSKVMNQSDVDDLQDMSSCTQVSSKSNTTSTSLVLFSSMMEEENADSILEEHCSRIWKSPEQQTPSRSPGHYSPRAMSPDRLCKFLSQTHPGILSKPGILPSKPLQNKQTEYMSFNSGMGEDTDNKVETHKRIHYHHHHDRGRKSKHKLELQAQQHRMVCWGDGTSQPHTGSKLNPANSCNHSDLCSNMDIDQPHPDVIKSEDPTTTKVSRWILDNDNIKRGTRSAFTDSDKTSSTCRLTNRSSALTTAATQPYKCSCSKKCNSLHMNWSTSANNNNCVPWNPHGNAVGEMPSQPIAQDPSMPIMPPPNTRVQLEEVGRRLHEADALSINPIKSKSFTGVPSKERRVWALSSQRVDEGCSLGMPCARTIPADLCSSAENRIEKRPKRSSGSGNILASSNPEETNVGYILCGGDEIPYKITIPHATVTLGLLKQHIGKRGSYRYYAKTYDKNFDSEAVFEEIREDNKVLPEFEGKILVKVEKKDEMDTSNKSYGSDKRFT